MKGGRVESSRSRSRSIRLPGNTIGQIDIVFVDFVIERNRGSRGRQRVAVVVHHHGSGCRWFAGHERVGEYVFESDAMPRVLLKHL